MNTPFRAIISDLDGTLLNAEHTLGQFTIETLEKLAAAGVGPAGASQGKALPSPAGRAAKPLSDNGSFLLQIWE